MAGDHRESGLKGRVTSDGPGRKDAAPARALDWGATIPPFREFPRRRDGMIHAMDGGLWLHRHVWRGRPMAHLVSTDREHLLAYGRAVGLPPSRLQFKPLKDPRTGVRREAWHWDLVGDFLPEGDDD